MSPAMNGAPSTTEYRVTVIPAYYVNLPMFVAPNPPPKGDCWLELIATGTPCRVAAALIRRAPPWRRVRP